MWQGLVIKLASFDSFISDGVRLIRTGVLMGFAYLNREMLFAIERIILNDSIRFHHISRETSASFLLQ